jgi:hypothetical protein
VIVIDSRQLTQLRAKLESVSKNSKRDMGRALSSTQRSTRTETTKATADAYTAGKQRVGKNTRVSKVDTNGLFFTITGLREPIQLQEYRHTASKRNGVTATVKKGSGAQRLPTAFKVTAGNFGGGGAKKRIFMRARTGNGQVGRLPIKSLFGPSVADMLNNPALQERVGTFALNKLSTEIIRLTEVAFRG